jgi:hypothetical protein
LLQSDFLRHFKIIAITEKALVRENLYLEDHFSGSNVYELVSCVPEAFLVAVWRACFDEDVELVEGLLGIVALALVACGRLRLAFSAASIALRLELLDEPWTKSLRFHNDSLAITLRAHLDVLGVIRPSTATVRTERIPCILDLHLFACVDILERHFQFDVHIWSGSLFLRSLSTATEEAAKDVEWVAAATIWLVEALFAVLIVLSPPLGITERVIGGSDVLILFHRFLITFVLVRMVLDAHFLKGFLDFAFLGTPRNTKDLVEVPVLSMDHTETGVAEIVYGRYYQSDENKRHQ